MKSQILVYFLSIFILFSCKNQDKELTEMNSFLQANFEFNNRTLNKNKGDYYRIIEEMPSREIEKLNELDSRFESLISAIDRAIKNKEKNLENIIAESNEILNEVPKIVDNRKDYLLPEFKQPKTDSKDLSLKYIKNRLVIAMAYSFEYASRQTYSVDGLYKVDIDSIISRKTDSGIKLTLTSRFGQPIKENRHILINKIELNGKEQKIDFELKDNYSFADIELDSLQSGIYKMNGILRFYHREQKFDIPFEKEFKVE
ncbi:hypothetical protein ACFSQ0_05640 [Mesonia sediminis]|uniref:Gliding motility-associated protein GldM N-terminal domain-containing protein n=1 Tax=Mesonia sediminis TaxID=1703946 RepID=A0ABW5SCB2_9FLAO